MLFFLCRQRMLNQIVCKQSEFLEVGRRVRTEQLVSGAAQLAHMDDALAHHIWLTLFPALWTTLDDKQLPVRMYYSIGNTASVKSCAWYSRFKINFKCCLRVRRFYMDFCAVRIRQTMHAWECMHGFTYGLSLHLSS